MLKQKEVKIEVMNKLAFCWSLITAQMVKNASERGINSLHKQYKQL